MKRFFFEKLFAGVLASLSLFAFISCGEDTGLGSTVDTLPPELSISYPPDDAYVKGSFVFAGTCSDDKGVTRIEVSVKKLEKDGSTKDYGTSLADIKDSLTWSMEVNKSTDTGFELPDGIYKLEVTAWDRSGRKSGTIPRQFQIDNTPPVFVITKPGVNRKTFLSENSISKYGSLFAIEGTIADDHSIASMDITIYDKDGNLVAEPYSEKDISTTGGTSVTIARYIEGGIDELNTRYNDIYGVGDADASGNKIYSCSITIADSTKEYKNPGDGGVEGGNSTSVVYLYDDIYEDYMSAKKGAGLSANDFRSVLNGTATDASLAGKGIATDVTVEKVRAALNKFAKDTTNMEDDSLSFSLNPNADPTYNISGFNLNYNEAGTAISAGTNKAMGEQPLTIIVSAGLDQVNIDPKSLKVYIKKIIDADKAHITKDTLNKSIANLVTKVSELEIDLANANESSDSSAQKEAEAQLSVIDGWNLLLDNSQDPTPSDKTVTLSTELPASNYIEANAYYAIVVTGCDKDGIKLSQTKNYGFIGTVSAVPPSASFTSPKDLAYFANSKYIEGSETDKLVFTGTATENNAGMTLREITATLTVSDESSGKELPDSIQVTIKGDANNKWTKDGGLSCVYDEESHTNIWTFIPSLCGEAYQKIMAVSEGLMYLYNVNIKVTGTSALSYEMSRSVHIDTTKPVVQITSVSPLVYGKEYFGEDSEYKNYTFINSSILIQGSINEVNLENVAYDVRASEDLTADLSDEKYSVLKEIKEFYTKLGVENSIDGELGKIRTLDKKIRTDLVTNYFLATGKITKDQPIKARVVFRAIDNVGNVGEYNSIESNDGEDFYIYQETNRPKVTLGNAELSYKDGETQKSLSVDTEGLNKNNLTYEHNLFGTTNNNKLSVSFSDDDSVVEYEIFIAEDGKDFKKDENGREIPFYTATPNKTSASVNCTLPENEGVYKVKILARDFIRSDAMTDENEPYGVKEIGPFYIAVDSGAPILSLSNPQDGAYVTRSKEISNVKGTVSKKDVKISGFICASDDKDKKHLKDFELSVDKENPVNGVYNWTGKIESMPAEGNEFKLEITAVDNYGQSSTVISNLKIDEDAPVWDEAAFLVNKATYKSGNDHTWYKASSLPFAGKYKEKGSGIDYVEYTVIKAGETEGTTENFGTTKDTDEAGNLTGEESFSANLGEFERKIGESGTLPNKVIFVAVDKAGNRSVEKTVEIYIDTEVPTLDNLNRSGSQFSNKKLPIEVTGTAADDSSGVKSISLNIYLNGGTDVLKTYPVTSSDKFAHWTATIDEDFLKDLENKTYVVKAFVEDNAGNQLTQTIFRIDVDDEKPVIKNIGLANSNTAYSVYYNSEDGKYFVHNKDGNTFTINGSISDKKSGIAKIELLDSSGNAVTVQNESGNPVTFTSLPMEGLTFTEESGSIDYKIRATDNAGNVEEETITICFDNEAPKGIHAIDGSDKDIFFRISNLNNWKWNGTEGEIENWDPKYDEDLGGKYSPFSYGNNQTVRVRGNISDKDSGVNMIYYKVVNTGTFELPQEGTEVAVIDGKTYDGLNKIAETFLKNYKTDNDNTGYFSTNKEETKRVTYTSIGSQDMVYDTNGALVKLDGSNGKGAGTIFEGFVSGCADTKAASKRAALITTNYDQSFTGFKDGHNYLILVAVDNVGNASIDSVNVVTKDTQNNVVKTLYSNFTLNVDTETPELKATTRNGEELSSSELTLLSNGEEDITVGGTFDDNFSTVKTIIVEIIDDNTKKLVTTIDETGNEVVNEYAKITLSYNSATKPASNLGTFDGSAKTWSAVIKQEAFPANTNATYSVKATITDRAGNESSQTLFVIQWDTVDPEFKNVTLSQNSTAYQIYRPDETEDKYYANPDKGTFKIEGIATDGPGIKEVRLSIPGVTLENNKVESGTFKFEGISLASLTGDSVKATLTAFDKAGNSATKEITITFDKTAPNGIHNTDTDENDRTFRIGEGSGEKYSSKSYGKNTTAIIRGYFNESQSGLSMIYYKVLHDLPTASDATSFLSNYKGSSSGYFTPLSSESTETIDGETITTNYKANIPSLQEGKNYLLLVALDNVGNAALDSVTYTYTTKNDSEEDVTVNVAGCYLFNVDTLAPTLTSSLTGVHFTNKVTDFEIKGAECTFTDNDSGVKSIKLTVKGETVDGAIPADANRTNGTWSAIIPKNILSTFENGTYAVKAEIEDFAGCKNSFTVFTLQVDTEAPGVRITTPQVGSKINGKTSISGSVPAANIGAIPAKFELYYTTIEPTAEATRLPLATGETSESGKNYLNKIGESIAEITDIYSWSFNTFDTDALFNSLESDLVSKKVYLVPVVYDEAGNCNIYDEQSGSRVYKFTKGNGSSTNTGNYFEYTVDRNTDRPIIQITSINSGEIWISNATLRGTISDDDGIKEFYISRDGINWGEAITVNNGSWSYPITDGDGPGKELYFKVVDSDNKEFTTSNSNRFNRPYYLYGNTASSQIATDDYGLDNTEAIIFNLDTESPRVEEIGLAIGSNVDNYDSNSNPNGLYTVEQVAGERNSVDYKPSTTRYAGGNKKYIKFYVPVYDGNLDTVTISISNSDGTVETQLFKTVNAGSLASITTDSITLSAIAPARTIDVETSSDVVTYTYWETPVLDVSGVETGTKTITIVAMDKTGADKTVTKNFFVDMTGPNQITVTSPASTDEVTGTVNVVGTASDVGIGIKKIEWLVPPKNYTTTMTDAVLAELEGWNSSNNNKTVSVFSFRFTAGSTTDLTTYDDTEKYAVNRNEVTNIYTIPLFFKTTDELGNIYIDRSYKITHNPDADRPVTEFSYPTANDYDKGNNYITLSGVIRATGTVSIPSGTTNVGQVYIQIGKISTDASGNTTVAWANGRSDFASEITTLGGAKTKADILTTYKPTNVEDSDFASKNYIPDDWWGIPVTTKSTTWNVSLNTKGNLDPTEGSANKIAVRACAINEDGKMGLWTDTSIAPVYIHVDLGAPSQTSEMRQYTFSNVSDLTASNAETNSEIKVRKEYTPEMYLKGTWYLAVTLSDSESINKESISVKRGSAPVTPVTNTETNSSVKIYIPIETTSMTSKSVSYTVYVEDGSTPPHSSTMTYTFYIDNDAPAIESLYNGENLAANESNKLSEDKSSDIADSNYIYTLGGKVDETGSGFDKVVFYYVRPDGFGTPAVLDPFITTGHDEAKAVIATDGLTTIDVNGNSNLKLYGKEITAGTTTAESTDGVYKFSHDDVSNIHIRAGGLIFIGGEFGVITKIESGYVIFKSNATISDADTTAFFPYAQVVDNTGTEKTNSTNGKDFGFASGDDGDGMPEVIGGSKATGYTWTGTMHTTNIPDGPAKLVVLAFDKAGNVSGKTLDVKVVNNAPRLAKLYLGTDLNSSGTWSSNEFEGWSINTVFSENTELNKELDAGGFKIKDKLAVAAEIVGGNESIIMVYKKGAGNSNSVRTDSTGAVQGTIADLSSYVTDLAGKVKVNGKENDTTLYGFTLANNNVAGTSEEDKSMNASFTFWDKTDETEQGKTSQNCVVLVKNLYVDLTDGLAPKVVINPFYWDSAEKNSLYENSKNNGHIELEKDWMTTSAYTNSGTNAEYDADPKVSGKITFTGTAYDDRVLKSLSFKLTNSAGTTYSGFSADMATYDPTKSAYTTNGGWSALSGNSGSTLANGGIYEWSISTTENDENRKYGDDCYLSQKGHKVYWTISIDTEQISGVAATDVKLTVTANDKTQSNPTAVTKPVTTGETYVVTDGTTNVPGYQMDVVPYITKLSTRLDDAYSVVPSVFNRSANGVYPVIRGETGIKLYGFNLNGASTIVKFNGNSVGSVSAKPSSDTTAGNYVSFKVPADNATSGKVEVFIGGANGIVSLNNMNNETEEYNLEPNNMNNNTLTDDRRVYVWGMSNILGSSVSTIRYPTFRIGKGTGQPYAFVYDNDGRTVRYNLNGSDKLLDTSYSQWYGTACAIDSDGHIYASAQNGDSTSSNYANYKFYAFADSVSGNAYYDTTSGAYTTGGNSINLEWDYDNGAFFAERIKNPKIATLVSDDKTKMYTVYYDSAYSKLVFRYGTSKYDSQSSVRWNAGITARGSKSSASGAYTIDNSSNVGEYAAVGVIPTGLTGLTGGTAVVCWKSGDALKFMYNETPSNSSTWKTNCAVIDSDYAGEYCDLAVDSAGGIHIAYYRAGNKLKYAYLESYKATKADVCMVDSYLSVGENISIETSSKTISYKDGSATKYRYVPYISYYSNAIGLAKVAWPVKLGKNSASNNTNTFVDGATSDMFTGDWEVQVLPTALTTKILNYTIGVGEKKNGNKDKDNNDIQSVMLGYGTKTGLQTALLY